MKKFLEIKCMNKEEQKKILDEIEKAIKGKMKDKVLSEREVRKIEEMKLRPLLDIQDVQGVYQDLMFKPKKKK